MSNNKPLISANISNLTSSCASNIRDAIFNCLKNPIIPGVNIPEYTQQMPSVLGFNCRH